jgi:hypothetical protein
VVGEDVVDADVRATLDRGDPPFFAAAGGDERLLLALCLAIVRRFRVLFPQFEFMKNPMVESYLWHPKVPVVCTRFFGTSHRIL